MKGKGPALLIGVMPKGKGEGEKPEMDDEEGEGEDSSKEAKMAAAKALISAVKAGDEEALSEALDAYMSC